MGTKSRRSSHTVAAVSYRLPTRSGRVKPKGSVPPGSRRWKSSFPIAVYWTDARLTPARTFISVHATSIAQAPRDWKVPFEASAMPIPASSHTCLHSSSVGAGPAVSCWKMGVPRSADRTPRHGMSASVTFAPPPGTAPHHRSAPSTSSTSQLGGRHAFNGPPSFLKRGGICHAILKGAAMLICIQCWPVERSLETAAGDRFRAACAFCRRTCPRMHACRPRLLQAQPPSGAPSCPRMMHAGRAFCKRRRLQAHLPPHDACRPRQAQVRLLQAAARRQRGAGRGTPRSR